MIDKAVDILKKEIQSYLSRLPEFKINTEKKVEMTPIVKFDGSVAIPDNSLGITLVNIEEERVAKVQKAAVMDGDGRVSHINPEIKLNLYLMIAANFSNYNTGLEFLSGAVRFFQSKNVFTADNTPMLDSSIEKLVAELYTLSFEQQNHLWGTIGGKYMPSVLYKVRLISIQEGLKIDEEPPVKSARYAGKGI